MMDSKPPLNEALLMHFGVKGMRWGVRKEADLSGLSSQRGQLSKGAKLQNLSPDAPRKLGEHVYVTHTPRDNLIYKGGFSWLLMTRRNADSVYQNVFTAKKDIKIASERDAVESFMALYRKDPRGLLEDLASSQFDLAATQQMYGAAKGQQLYGKSVSKETKRLMKKGESYLTSPEGIHALSGMLVKDVPSRKGYFLELSRRGLDAIVDEHDRREGADHPLIILNGKGVLASGKSKKLTENDINLALAKRRENVANGGR